MSLAATIVVIVLCLVVAVAGAIDTVQTRDRVERSGRGDQDTGP